MHYFLRRKLSEILPFLDAVSNQADDEREALGFLPAPAYVDAAHQNKLILLLSNNDSKVEYVGHLLFGGIFPHLRVRQICVKRSFRGHGHATTLIRALKSQGESEGYLSILANVATDLASANAFYEKNGFITRRLKLGGLTRKRTINVKTLQLDTPSLISLMTDTRGAVELVQPRMTSAEVPLYAIDLNVFFDVIKKRPRSEDAGALFEAALSHQIRLSASSEFVRELERHSYDKSNDPILSLAKRIPILPTQPKDIIDSILPLVTNLTFTERSRSLSVNDKSDVLHLCHAISAGAAGYITSDEKVLEARDSLMSEFGLDIIALSEFVALLELPTAPMSDRIKSANNFRISSTDISQLSEFLESQNILADKFFELPLSQCSHLCISDGDGLIGASVTNTATALNTPARALVCVSQEHPHSSTVADYLISEQIRFCSKRSGCVVTLLDIPHHPITRRVALTHGYQPSRSLAGSLTKVALCSPVTKNSWNSMRLSVERLGSLKIQETPPQYDSPSVKLTAPEGDIFDVPLFELESLLSPTLFALPHRQAVVVPITASFANALLGTDEQLSFLEVPEAQFLSRRTYFNTVRAANAMIRGSVIAFYESMRGGGHGRGAIVALARIVDVTIVANDSVPELIQRAAVVDDLRKITKAHRTLSTTFDNLIRLKSPVPFSKLQQIGCAPRSNFVSATRIASDHLEQIVLAGFPDE